MSGFGEGRLPTIGAEATAAGSEFGLVVGADGRLGDVSLAARLFLGLDGTSPRHMSELVAEDWGGVEPFLQRCLVTRAPVTRAVDLHGPGGVVLSLACTGTPLGADEVLLICRPAQEAPGMGERIQAKLMTLARELEDRARSEGAARHDAASRSRFLAAASHDLRQPLHAMTLFTRALSRRVEGEEATELVRQLGLALGALQGMFGALLDISKLDGGLVEPSFADVDLAELITSLGEDLEMRAAATGLRARVRCLDVAVRTDRALLERVLRHLIDNALRFTERGGVLLAVRRRGDRIAIEVVDTGCGMTEEELAASFGEFERRRAGARGPNDGLGLGLSIVERVVALLGVRLEAASRPGHGTRMRLILPSARSRDRVHRPALVPSARRAGTGLRGRTILVLDDDPLAVDSLSRELRDQGAEVVPVGSAGEIDGAVGQRTIEAAVVDFDLGDQAGPIAVEAWRQATGRRFPMLVVTGSTQPEILQLLQATGAPWIAKPVDGDVLLALLEGMLD